jgi:Bardet-Biedl syndrome 9 protein
VIATFVTPEGEPRTARCEFELPLALVAHVVPPVKASTFKITLDTDQPAAPLADLFDDFAAMAAAAGEPLKAAATVLSLRYTCGFDVSILLSKNAGRYRLQCGAFEPLCLVAHELCARLRRAMPAVVVGFSEPLPLHELFELVDAHLASRAAVAALNRELEERATQFRAIQKRLLVRFKDRNPAPLANLDLLLQGTHAQLMELADRVGRAHAARDTAATSLSSAVQLINLLIALRFRLDDDNRVALAAHLSPRVHSLSEQGWEERTDAALTHALRTSLGKGGAAAAGALAPPAFSVPTDASKLKKHITVMCDRISKGARFK